MNKEKLKQEMKSLLDSEFVDFTKEYGITGWDAFEKWFDEKYKSTPITEKGLRDRGFKMRTYNNVIRHYYIMCTPANYRRQHELYFRFGLRKDSKKDELDEQGWVAYNDSGTVSCFNCETFEDVENLYEAICKKQLINKNANKSKSNTTRKEKA